MDEAEERDEALENTRALDDVEDRLQAELTDEALAEEKEERDSARERKRERRRREAEKERERRERERARKRERRERTKRKKSASSASPRSQEKELKRIFLVQPKNTFTLKFRNNLLPVDYTSIDIWLNTLTTGIPFTSVRLWYIYVFHSNKQIRSPYKKGLKTVSSQFF